MYFLDNDLLNYFKTIEIGLMIINSIDLFL